VCPPVKALAEDAPNHENDEEDCVDEDGTSPIGVDVPTKHPLMHTEKAGMVKQALRSTARVESVVMCSASSVGKPHKAMVRTVQYREAEVGDKLCSRHGQKGVIGRVVKTNDMPFEKGTGLQPDMIINANAFPSRMTVGHLMEMVGGLVGLKEGRCVPEMAKDLCIAASF